MNIIVYQGGMFWKGGDADLMSFFCGRCFFAARVALAFPAKVAIFELVTELMKGL